MLAAASARNPPSAIWDLVEALCGIGRTEDAEALFEGLLQVRNDLGLLSEQYDTRTGRQMGNVPQAFSMVGLINSALTLSGGHAASGRPHAR